MNLLSFWGLIRSWCFYMLRINSSGAQKFTEVGLAAPVRFSIYLLFKDLSDLFSGISLLV